MRAIHALSKGALLAALAWSTTALAVPLSFTKLTGTTGGSPAATAVYKGDLSSLGLASIGSLSIADNSSGLGGAPGQFSGFDLDAIKISTTDCADAACASSAAGLAVFNFGSGLFFTPGVQRAPVDPKLFGTGPAGNTVDNAVARLALFDGNSTTAIPGADGFVSLGDNGILAFNLNSLIDPSGLFLYIGEVGDNGEVAAAGIDVKENRVPEPLSGALFLAGMLTLVGLRKARC